MRIRKYSPFLFPLHLNCPFDWAVVVLVAEKRERKVLMKSKYAVLLNNIPPSGVSMIERRNSNNWNRFNLLVSYVLDPKNVQLGKYSNNSVEDEEQLVRSKLSFD